MASTTGLPSGAAKKPRSKPSHPRTSDMVDAAIKSLKERGGSSLQAIKKYIAATYKLDAEKLSPFIKKYLKSGVVAKKLVQTKAKGAAGSFKLSVGSAAGEKKASVASSAGKRKKSPTKKKPATAAVKKAAKKSPIKPKKSLPAKPPKPKLSKRAAGRKPAAKK